MRLLKGIFKLVRDRPTPQSKKAMALLQHGAVSTFAQYAASLLALAYPLGGDLLTAMEKLAGMAKLFGGG